MRRVLDDRRRSERRGRGSGRGRLGGRRLRDVGELFTVDEAGGGPPPGLPLIFGPDGYLYFSSAARTT